MWLLCVRVSGTVVYVGQCDRGVRRFSFVLWCTQVSAAVVYAWGFDCEVCMLVVL